MVQIIGVSGVSGAGKTAITKKLGTALQATTVFWDEYDAISQAPKDYVEWYKTTRDYNEWKYEALEKVLQMLKSGKSLICPATKRMLIATPYVIFDAPLGYNHKATGKYIDFLVFLDTPLDIALARRLLRDYKGKPISERDEEHPGVLEDLQHYVEIARPVFLASYDIKKNCNLVLDGSLDLDNQVKTV